MRFGEKLLLYICRPIYRIFLERPLWSFLTKIKGFLLAEITQKLEDMQSRDAQCWRTIDERLQTLEAENTARWAAIEELLLAMFRQPQITNPFEPPQSPSREVMPPPINGPNHIP